MMWCFSLCVALHCLLQKVLWIAKWLTGSTWCIIEETRLRVGWLATGDYCGLQDWMCAKLCWHLGAETCETVSLSYTPLHFTEATSLQVRVGIGEFRMNWINHSRGTENSTERTFGEHFSERSSRTCASIQAWVVHFKCGSRVEGLGASSVTCSGAQNWRNGFTVLYPSHEVTVAAIGSSDGVMSVLRLDSWCRLWRSLAPVVFIFFTSKGRHISHEIYQCRWCHSEHRKKNSIRDVPGKEFSGTVGRYWR